MKIVRKIAFAAASLVFLLLFLFGAALIAVRLSGGRIFAVQTASMQNIYPVGSMIIVKYVAPEQLHEGDIISFVADEKLTVVTHRVVENDTENSCVYTKGDMNNTADSNPVAYDNVIGTVRLCIPKLGYVANFMHKKSVKILFAALGIAAAVLIIGYICAYIIGRQENTAK
jgi:signal peptidase